MINLVETDQYPASWIFWLNKFAETLSSNSEKQLEPLPLIRTAADPYCEFTKSIGAEIDRHDRGQGMRSARYTMLIDNNVVKKIQAEEDTATCEISAAQNFLKLI